MDNNIYTVKLLDIVLPWVKRKPMPQGIFLVMTYENQDLGQVFSANKEMSFSFEHAKLILYNLLCAVNFLHSANVMHRNIMPSNILLTEQCSVNICGFGSARILPKEVQAFSRMGNLLAKQEPRSFQRKSLFEKRSIAELLMSSRLFRQRMDRQLSPNVTSRWYRSPEVILKDKIYSFKSDIWSIGCTFSECISFTNSYKRRGGREQDKRVLFPGTSCFPMSPGRAPKPKENAPEQPPISDGD